MNKVTFLPFLLSLLAVPGIASHPGDADPEPGFLSLFNGKDLSGWVVMGNPAGWRVEDGCLRSDGGRGGRWIRTDRRFGNFVFRLEWMLSTAGNSGVFIRTGAKNVAPGVEVQLLAPWTPHRDDLHCTGSIYGHKAVHHRPDETPNRWRRMEIRCLWNEIVVKVDGEECCRAEVDKTPSLKNFGRRGYVGMQDSHTGRGQWVRFRNLRIKDLDRDPRFLTASVVSTDREIRRRARMEAIDLGAPMVAPLFRLYASGNGFEAAVAENTLFSLVTKDAAADSKRTKAVVTALHVQLARGSPARRFAARLLGVMARDEESVRQLLLAMDDSATAEAARQALQRIPGEAATKALLTALTAASDSVRPALVHALGVRRDRCAAAPLAYWWQAGDPATKEAVIDALGLMGGTRARLILAEAARSTDPALRRAAACSRRAVEDTLRKAKDSTLPPARRLHVPRSNLNTKPR